MASVKMVFQIWKTSELEDFKTTSRKSSRRLLGSLPDDFQEMVLIFHLEMFFRSGFDIHVFRSGSDFGRPMGSLFGSLLKYNALEEFQEVFQTASRFFITRFSSSTHLKVFQIWKTSGLEDFQTTSKKSSRGLPGSLLTESSPMSPFHNRSERFGFNQVVLIFHLDKSGSDFGRPMGRLLGSLLKYNALEDFLEVFQMTSKKSSRRLRRSLPDDFEEVFQTTSKKSSRRLRRSLPDDFQEVF
ncbi:hypothetical protein DY000_02003638 [Brassica cretica]|uniref:Uncharacterized protein n=1 Tax=Brassica cretica TaxID=69181 RepID=A0ABQ7C151_BRACR|nr:hypothetical protein DY000_02003638 [Brassica cretica]